MRAWAVLRHSRGCAALYTAVVALMLAAARQVQIAYVVLLPRKNGLLFNRLEPSERRRIWLCAKGLGSTTEAATAASGILALTDTLYSHVIIERRAKGAYDKYTPAADTQLRIAYQ